MKPVLIIGGTGVFGKRLVRHLSKRDGIALYVSSRSTPKAAQFIASLENSTAPLHPVALDCGLNLQQRLTEIKPFIVVDCSGPFQNAGYDTARTVLQNGAHLIDLADARDYLANFSDALNTIANANNVAALTGASSTPTLSTCVAEHLTQNWTAVDSIDIAITPGGKSEVGRSVIEAIMSYAGRAIPIWRGGALTQTTGWSRPQTITIPGLGQRRVAAVETYDAEYLGPHLGVRSRVAFSAGLESKIEQWGIEAIAALRKRGWLNSLDWLIPPLLKARKLTRIPTSDEGGMIVNIVGQDETGTPTQALWSLIAKQDHGPYIPILPAAAAIERLLTQTVVPGARLAHTAVTLSDVLKEMRPYHIKTQTAKAPTQPGVFERALGTTAFAKLPAPLRNLHDPTGPTTWTGKADIVSGKGVGANILARLFGFPKAGHDIPVTVSIDRITSPDGAFSEIWTRNFAGRTMQSTLSLQDDGQLTERFTPFTFTIAVEANQGGLTMPVSGWRLGVLPLPQFLAPRSDTREYVDDQDRFCFDVRLSAPLIGPIVQYQGWLRPTQK